MLWELGGGQFRASDVSKIEIRLIINSQKNRKCYTKTSKLNFTKSTLQIDLLLKNCSVHINCVQQFPESGSHLHLLCGIIMFGYKYIIIIGNSTKMVWKLADVNLVPCHF